jgi:hypothetical protein
VGPIDKAVRTYFAHLALPDDANLYDLLYLCLRQKDAIFTFNWDRFLLQSRTRIAGLGVSNLPQLFFLHGNVLVGFCVEDQMSRLLGDTCRRCRKPLVPSKLLFPVEKKNYDDPFIAREWRAVQAFLREAFMLTVFGYSAPTTDVEAIDLLKEGWGNPIQREMEQTEIINRPGSDHDALESTWKPSFIHTTSRFTTHSSTRGWPTTRVAPARRTSTSTGARSSSKTTGSDSPSRPK